MSDDDHSQPQTEVAPKAEDANAPINIKVRTLVFSFISVHFLVCRAFLVFSVLSQVLSSTGEEVFFKIKRSTKLVKLHGAYASKVGKDVTSIRSVFFLYICLSFLFFFSLYGIRGDPCARDSAMEILCVFDLMFRYLSPCLSFSLDFCTMELGYKMMTPQHHLIWKIMVC